MHKQVAIANKKQIEPSEAQYRPCARNTAWKDEKEKKKEKRENQRFEQNTFHYQITITAGTKAIHLLNNRVSRIGPKRIWIRLQKAKKILHIQAARVNASK